MLPNPSPDLDSWRQREQQLEAFERAWQEGTTPDLIQFLPGPPEDCPELLVELVRVDREFRRKQHLPEPDYLGCFLQLRDNASLCSALPPSVVEHDSSASTIKTGAAAAPATPRDPVVAKGGAPLPVVPGYEILEELGRGGMGIVYKARHLRLKRLVALKMIRGLGVGRDEQERFSREAEAIAQLSHPNIVQIHETGECGGQPFFSLEYVNAGSLDRKLAGTPQSPREAAQLVEVLARAIQAAHDKGIIHRDLKPSNVLLDETGNPKITDFGLAKKLEGGPGLTQSGDIMGTPSYMAPEQAQGKTQVIGPLVDVYALGAVLYECLTGRPPFKASTSLETMLQVIDQEPVPPSRLNPTVSRDLETICLKCLQKEVRKRYGTALDLAEDLRRFQADEPILARPVGKVARSLRWCWRNPLTATLLATLVVVIVLAFVSITLLWLEAESQKANAEQRFDEVRDAVNRYFTQVGSYRLLNEPGMQPLRKQLLEIARDYYQKFVGERAQDSSIREDLGWAYFRLGTITDEIGPKADAVPLFQKALDIFAALVRADPTSPALLTYRKAQGNCLANLGVTQMNLGQLDKAEAAFTKADAIQAELVLKQPDNQDFHRELAWTQQHRGQLFLTQGNLEEAEACYKRALKIREALGTPSTDLQAEIGANHDALGNFYAQAGRWTEAETHHRRALAIREKMMADQPGLFGYQHELALTQENLAVLYLETERADAAEKAHQKAQSIWEQLVRWHPRVAEYRFALASSHSSFAAQLRSRGRTPDAENALQAALALLKQLVHEDATMPDYRDSLAQCHLNLGEILHEGKRYREAEANFQLACALLTPLIRAHPQVPQYRHGLAMVEYAQGMLYFETNRLTESGSVLQSALVLQQNLVKEFPTVLKYQDLLANCYGQLSLWYRSTGQPLEAEAAIQKAVHLLESSTVGKRGQPPYQSRLGLLYDALGELCQGTGRMAEAEAAYRKALTIREKLHRDHPRAPSYQNLLAGCHHNLGTLYVNTQRPSEAQVAYQKAQTLWENLVKTNARLPGYLHSLADNFCCVGNLHRGGRRPAEAETAYQKALALWEQLTREYREVSEYEHRKAATYIELGFLYQGEKRPAEAEAAYHKALSIQERLVRENPNQASFTVNLCGLYCDLGGFMSELGKKEDAIHWYGRAISRLEAFLKKESRHTQGRTFITNASNGRATLLVALGRFAQAIPDWDRAIVFGDGAHRQQLILYRALTRLRDGQHAQAIAEARALRNQVNNSGHLLFQIAGLYSVASAVVLMDSTMPQSRRTSLANEHAREAIALLVEANRTGYFKDQLNLQRLREEPDFHPLTDRPEFGQFLRELTHQPSLPKKGAR